MSELDQKRIAVLEREIRIKERELELREAESKKTAWKSPIVLAVLAAAVGALGNAVVAYYNADLARESAAVEFQRTHQLESVAAENARILELIKTGIPTQVKSNLEFLIQAGLVTSPDLIDSIEDYYARTDPSAGPGISVGDFLDTLTTQESALSEAISEGRASLFKDSRSLTIRFPADQMFVGDSAAISAEITDVLDVVAQHLSRFRSSTIKVSVHTDGSGGDETQIEALRVRANAVVNEMIRLGVESPRVSGIGVGAGEPIADNSTPEGRAVNRRVEISIFPY